MTTHPRLRIGPIEIDERAHRLWRDGQPVAIPRKTFALLLALVARPGELVTKGQLLDEVWAGRIVTDAALSRAIRELRVALGDAAASPRFVETVHGLGFRFIAPVSVVAEEASPAPADSRDASSAEACGAPSLAGRAPEIEKLDGAFDAALAGRRQVVFITGEAGIGKTALVEAFLARHEQAGACWAAQGRCIEQYGNVEPHLPLLEALEHLAQHCGTKTFVDVFARYAPTWLAQLPWLASQADRTLLERATAETTHQRMVRELAHALDVLSSLHPIVIWLEDLHWSDPSSLEVISFLAGRRDAARLLLLGSFRPADVQAAATPLHGLTVQLVQRGQAQEIALRLLDVAAVAQYLARRFGDAPGLRRAELAAFIHRRTDGNALFTVNVVDDLLRRGELVQQEGAWMLRAGVTGLRDRLPETLRRLVHEQLDRLREPEQRMVEAAAVVGASFSAAAIAAALGTDVATVEDGCARLAHQGRFFRVEPAVAWPDGTVAAGFAFLHALVLEGVGERIPEGRRADWQRRIGERIESAYAAQPGAVAAELAMRFEAARDFERCLRHLRRAGEAALARCAYPESVDQLRHGIALVPNVAPERRVRHELDLLLPLGAALMAAQGYASDDVAATYRRALLLCESGGAPEDLVRALRGMWNVAFLRCDLAGAREAADKLLAQATALQNAKMAFDAHTKLGQTCLHAGELDAARSHLERALGAPEVETPAGLRAAPRIAAYLAWVRWYGGAAGDAARVCDQALEFAQRAASLHSSVFALGYVGWIRLMRGETETARSLAEQQLALSQEYGIAYWRQMAAFMLGVISAQRGELGPGIDTMRRAIDEMQSAGGQVGVPYLLCMLAEAQLAADRFADARAALASANELITTNGNWLYAAEAERVAGLLARAAGGRASLGVARRHFEAALAVARRQGARALELRAATCLARLEAEQGDPAQAVQALAPLVAAFEDAAETRDVAEARALLAGWGHARTSPTRGREDAVR